MIRALLALGLALAAAAAAFAPVHTARDAHGGTCGTCGACSRPAMHLHAQNATRPRVLVQIPVDGQRHERMLVELFSALLQTDDIALLERDAQAMGVAYLDTNFSMCRRPLLLRQSVRKIMQRYDLALAPLERTWTPVQRNQSQTPPPGFLDGTE